MKKRRGRKGRKRWERWNWLFACKKQTHLQVFWLDASTHYCLIAFLFFTAKHFGGKVCICLYFFTSCLFLNQLQCGFCPFLSTKTDLNSPGSVKVQNPIDWKKQKGFSWACGLRMTLPPTFLETLLSPGLCGPTFSWRVPSLSISFAFFPH